MTILYDKDGKEHKVAHQIDAKEWITAGYSLTPPPEPIEVKKTPPAKKTSTKTKETKED